MGDASSSSASSSSSSPSSSSSSSGGPSMGCPSPPPGGGSSWTDCSVGLDPSKNSGDLLWTKPVSFVQCFGGGPILAWPLLTLGPTADIGLAVSCGSFGGGSLATAVRLNGGGNMFAFMQYGLHSIWREFFIGPHNELVSHTTASIASSDQSQLELISGTGAAGLSWSDLRLGFAPQAAHFWATKLDPLGNVFSRVTTDHAVSLDGSLSLPAPGTYLTRGGPAGESFSTKLVDSFVPDGQGGVYLYGPLTSTMDFGCGPVVPGGPSSSYLAHLDASWACEQSRALPIAATVLPDAAGGVLLSATSPAALDLGCGALPSAPTGSSFVTRLSPQGTCVFARAVPAPNLTIALDPGDRVVVSGLVNASPVDLGGGPLAPVGVKDLVAAELDSAGNHLWSGRYGGAGVTLSSTSLTVATTGNLHLMTSFNGTVDFGGGPVTAAATETVIASFSSAGAHRMSRAITIVGGVVKGFDGCGGLVVASVDFSFDVGCGKVLPEPPPGAPLPAFVGLARFAP